MRGWRSYRPDRKLNKYRNEPTVINGIKFDSKAEARRYTELCLLLRAGEITHLKCHPKYPLMCSDIAICIRNKHGVKRRVFYSADFEYMTRSGEFVIEDVKGMDTPISRLKRGIMEAQYRIIVKIIKY